VSVAVTAADAFRGGREKREVVGSGGVDSGVAVKGANRRRLGSGGFWSAAGDGAGRVVELVEAGERRRHRVGRRYAIVARSLWPALLESQPPFAIE